MKLYSLTYNLIVSSGTNAYQEKHTINVPGASDSDARDKFLTALNSSEYFISPSGTFWPMLFTRAQILLTDNKPQSEPQNKEAQEVKKERKPRVAKKAAKKQTRSRKIKGK